MVLFVREKMFKHLTQEEIGLPSPVYSQARATYEDPRSMSDIGDL